ncbi:MAG: hypothetical protein M1825_004713 [Sarcosagium campestre]|nr:MAG: hypothetical protein M1825_004713 [Sarcosagium campestre]
MQEVSITGSSVWDPKSPSREGSRGRGSPVDALPPFSALTNDEDREKKAGSQEPGTFHVVVNLDSFHGLPEYSEKGNASDADSKADVRDRRNVPEGSLDGGSDHSSHSELPSDPNVVIIRRFDDTVRRPAPYPQQSSPMLSPSSSHPLLMGSRSSENLVSTDTNPGLRLRSESSSPITQETRLLNHYRQFISRHIAYTLEGSHEPGANQEAGFKPDGFEEEAARSPPLFHAMIALSALSFKYRDGLRSIDALQHYQRALPSLQSSLKSPRDLSSNGALFANFFLLLYEIAAAEQWGSSLWLQHLSQLLKIILIRRETFGKEHHSLMIWFVSVIDTYALLSASGNGDFVETILSRDMMPISEQQQHTICPLESSAMSAQPESQDPYTTVLLFSQRMLRAAFKLGQTANEIRAGLVQRNQNSIQDGALTSTDLTNWQARSRMVQDTLRFVWENDMPQTAYASISGVSSGYPPRIQAIFEHTCLLYWASTIYSHTSVWPCQLASRTSESEAEVDRCVRSIVNLSKVLVPAKRLELRFFIFPLFMAGYAATSADDKVSALDLIATVENESIGRNTTIVRRLLQEVYEKQNQHILRVGHSWGVHWIDIMTQSGLQGVKFSL